MCGRRPAGIFQPARESYNLLLVSSIQLWLIVKYKFQLLYDFFYLKESLKAELGGWGVFTTREVNEAS